MEASDTDIHRIFLPTHKDRQSHQLTFLISQAKCLLFFLFSFSLHENVIFDDDFDDDFFDDDDEEEEEEDEAKEEESDEAEEKSEDEESDDEDEN